MATKIINVLTLAGVVANAGYHHQEFIKIKLGQKPLPELQPSILPLEIPPNHESDINLKVNEIRSKATNVKPSRIEDIKAFFYGTPTKVKGKLVPNGEGQLQYDDNRSEIGLFNNGALEGAGLHFDPEQGTTIGNFKDGKLNGLGHLKTPEGGHYNGEFRNNEPLGRGNLCFKNGNHCNVLRTEEKQYATCYSINGKLFYDGEFNGLDAHGKGKLVLNEQGYTYEGDFVEGKRSGLGIERDTYGDLAYEGEYVDNMPAKKNIVLPETIGYVALGVFNIIFSLILKK